MQSSSSTDAGAEKPTHDKADKKTDVAAAPQEAAVGTVTVTVRLLSGKEVFGPKAVPRSLTVGDLKCLFEPKQKKKKLVLNERVLGDNAETLESWPDPVELNGMKPGREVICDDALLWLERPGSLPENCIVVTSLADSTEVKEIAPTIEEWKAWFLRAMTCVFKALPSRGVAVFYLTDIRIMNEEQVDKSHLAQKAADEFQDIVLRWHRIVHFGSIDRPSPTNVKYTHLLCFSRRAYQGFDLGSTMPDILARGLKPWGLRNSARCMGINATVEVLKWATRRLPHLDTVVDPFCGCGTALAIANEMGFHALGVDIDHRRVTQALGLEGAALLAGRRANNRAPVDSQDED